MQRASRFSQLLNRAAAQITAEGLSGALLHATDGSTTRLTTLLSLRTFGSSLAAAGGSKGCKALLQPQLPPAGFAAPLVTAAPRAAAMAAASCGGGAAGAWRAVQSAGARQQQWRGYARFLQFQPPSRGGGGGLPRLLQDPDKVLWGLIGANVAGFLLWRTTPLQMHTHAVVSIEALRSGRVWTALTAAFSHQDFMHLAANMIGLFFFGRDVGRLFGGKKLLLLYLAGGVVGSLAHCGWYFYKACQTGEGRYGRARWFGFTPGSLGASAAVNAITVVDILLYPSRTILLWGIVPMPAALLGVLWLLRDVSGTMEGRGHIAHSGHLGGAATGLAFFLLFKRGVIRPRGWY